MPDAARQKSKAGIKAFIRYYFDVFNYANAHDDWSYFKTLSEPGCENCFALTVDQPGRFVEGGQWTVADVSVTDKDGPHGRSALVKMRGLPGAWLSSPSAQPTRVKGQKWLYEAWFTWKDRSWTITRLDLIDY